MTYLPPPQVAFGDEITPYVVNRLRLGLTQWEQFFNFSSPPPDIKFKHRPAKFAMWSYQASSTAETTQFNATDIWAQNVFAFVIIASLRVGISADGGVGQLRRPTSGNNALTFGGVTLRIYSDGNVTLQHNTNDLRKTLVLLSTML